MVNTLPRQTPSYCWAQPLILPRSACSWLATSKRLSVKAFVRDPRRNDFTTSCATNMAGIAIGTFLIVLLLSIAALHIYSDDAQNHCKRYTGSRHACIKVYSQLQQWSESTVFCLVVAHTPHTLSPKCRCTEL